jgi:hypothetical protein
VISYYLSIFFLWAYWITSFSRQSTSFGHTLCMHGMHAISPAIGATFFNKLYHVYFAWLVDICYIIPVHPTFCQYFAAQSTRCRFLKMPGNCHESVNDQIADNDHKHLTLADASGTHLSWTILLSLVTKMVAYVRLLTRKCFETTFEPCQRPNIYRQRPIS